MTQNSNTVFHKSLSPDKVLNWSGKAWFTVAAIGQLAFIGFIVAFYYRITFSGDFSAWNIKPLIKGFQTGDPVGNMMFAVHVLMAAVMTLTGLMQLTPQIRSRAPKLHHISGRIFLILACALALGGFWLAWVRETRLSYISAYAITLNGFMILAFSVPTIIFAIKRQIAKHQRWAMRLFLVANGVWFLRIGIMGWIVIAKGPVGMSQTLSGPVDIVLVFGCYLIPLTIYEIYSRARASTSKALKVIAASLVLSGTLFTAIGSFGASAFMWLPYL